MHASALQRSTPWKQSATYYYLLLPKVRLQIHTRNPEYPEATFFKSLNHAGGRAFPGNTEVSRTWGRPTSSQVAVVWMHFERLPHPAVCCSSKHNASQSTWGNIAGRRQMPVCYMRLHVQTYDLNILNNWIWSAVALKPICFTGTTA